MRPPVSRETRRAASHARPARCSSARGASPGERRCCDPGGARRPFAYSSGSRTILRHSPFRWWDGDSASNVPAPEAIPWAHPRHRLAHGSGCKSVLRRGDAADTTRRRPRPSVHRPRRRSTQLRSLALSRTATAERCFSSHSPTLRPWITAKAASYVEGLWSPSLVFGGEIGRLTLTHIPSAISQAEAQRVFLSQAGPRFVLLLVQAEHHLLVRLRFRLRNDEGDPWVALAWSCYAARSS
jgi:hypothetical protein